MSSDGERAFKTLLIQLANDLPAPVAEYQFLPGRKFRFDFAWPEPEYRLALEVNGGRYAFGGGRHNTAADYHKIQTAVALGWRVFPVLPEQLRDDPHTVFDLLREALGVKHVA